MADQLQQRLKADVEAAVASYEAVVRAAHIPDAAHHGAGPNAAAAVSHPSRMVQEFRALIVATCASAWPLVGDAAAAESMTWDTCGLCPC